MKTVLEVIADLVIIIWFLYTVWWLFKVQEPDRPLEIKLRVFRYFTFLSNILSAVATLVILVFVLALGTLTALPEWVMILRMVGTACIAVTWLTVLVFLAPTVGKFLIWKDDNLFMHTVGPLLAMISFIFLENSMRFSLVYALPGGMPVVLYGCLYLYKVVAVGEEKGGWPDFYGFNKDGKWPVSFVCMICGGFLLSLALIALHNLFVK